MLVRRSRSLSVVVVLLVGGLVLLGGSMALATSSVLGTWQSVYPSSNLDETYGCMVCHTSGSSFNSYGSAVLSSWTSLGGSSGVLAQAIQDIESADSDGDGYTNGAEIAAGTLPGDATSHPTTDATPPSAPTNLSATAASSTQIDLSWTASTDNVGVTGYRVYRGGTLVGSPSGTSYSDTGLVPSTAYSYTVKAADAAGNLSAASNTASATTQDPTAPVMEAEVVAASLPAQMVKGYTAEAQITMRNTGNVPWTKAAGFALRVSDSSDMWGVSRVDLDDADVILEGEEKTFTFTMQAPGSIGNMESSWQMSQDGIPVTRFGQAVTGTVGVATFGDVPTDNWAWTEIEALCASDIVQGYPGSPPMYQPGWDVTRDQMAVYVSRCLTGGEAGVPDGSGGMMFPDMAMDHWASKYVEFCMENGVVEGYDDGYHPEEPVDRAQMAVFVARGMAAAGGPSLDTYTPPATPTFADVGTDNWAYQCVEYIADPSRAVTMGYPDELYHPEVIVTRDQMAVYMQRAFE